VPTDLDFLTQILGSESFRGGKADTTYLDHFKLIPVRPEQRMEKELALAAAWMTHQEKPATTVPNDTDKGIWRQESWREQMRGTH
jgi:acetyl/propionyl-CoA carboxylase alpha subunit